VASIFRVNVTNIEEGRTVSARPTKPERDTGHEDQPCRARQARRGPGGVLEDSIWQPDDDPGHIVIDLTFESVSAAADFRAFLFERVWSSPDAVPALSGRPRALILHQMANNQQPHIGSRCRP
jgi:hypothetical protein